MLARDALKEARLANPVVFLEDGEQLLAYLKSLGPDPDTGASRIGLILLDLKMPKKDGIESLSEIKADPHLRRIPIVILTTSAAEEDIFRSYDLGVNSFITKPVRFEALVEAMKTVGKYWFELVSLPEAGAVVP